MCHVAPEPLPCPCSSRRSPLWDQEDLYQREVGAGFCYVMVVVWVGLATDSHVLPFAASMDGICEVLGCRLHCRHAHKQPRLTGLHLSHFFASPHLVSQSLPCAGLHRAISSLHALLLAAPCRHDVSAGSGAYPRCLACLCTAWLSVSGPEQEPGVPQLPRTGVVVFALSDLQVAAGRHVCRGLTCAVAVTRPTLPPALHRLEGNPLAIPQNTAYHPTFGTLTVAGDNTTTQK